MVQAQIKGLNSLRFIAAFLVLAGHARLDLMKLSIPQPEWPCLRFGAYAVEFFFVLSGFLLTHLAIREYSSTKKIDIKGFFLRRILRIWPLYYPRLSIGFIIIAGIGPSLYAKASWPEIGGLLPYFIFMAPNLAIAIQPLKMGAVFALWSIGVEEQFYLFFPFLMLALLRSKKPLRTLAWLAAIYTTAYLFLFPMSATENDTLLRFLLTLKFHYMLLGCLAAMAWHATPDLIDRILPRGPITGWVLFCLALALIFIGPPPGPVAQTLCSGALYMAIILQFRNGSAHALFSNPWLDRLGRISYGIYMFHPYVSYLLRYAAQRFTGCQDLFATAPVAYYGALAIGTIGIAHFSFEYFESRFLRLKPHASTT